MKRVFIFILLLMGSLKQANAQEQLNKKQLADRFFEREEYFKSLGLYIDLARKNNPKINVIERVADCYRLLTDYVNAEQWYARAITYPNAEATDIFYYAEILLHNKKVDEAKEQYKAYYTKVNNPYKLSFKLAICDSAVKWMKFTNSFTLKNESQFNTAYSDWGLNYYGKSGYVFTSNRNITDDKKDIDNRTGNNYFKLYRAVADSIVLLELNTSGNPFFNGNFHIGPIAFNNTADTAYITTTTTVPVNQLPLDKRRKGSSQQLYTRRLQLITATKTNSGWGNFKSFPYNNIKQYSLGQGTLSTNGNIIYFVSDMPEGAGKTDIWYCTKQSDGTWGKPVNCGKIINTDEDEAFPTINNEVLYYSSDGLPGMGGYDIFSAEGEKADWRTPHNLKFPVNSTSDDFYYVSRDGVTGYFSSNREDGQGSDDIYSFSYKMPDNNIAKAPVKNTTPRVYQPIKTTDVFAFNNIYYNLDKADIRPDAAAELNTVAAILKTHPKMRIEISSHTDSRAPAAYNLELSKRRADSAVAYLVKQGISADRLVAKGYGDTRLINGCAKGVKCTEDEHQKNRRTEIQVLINE